MNIYFPSKKRNGKYESFTPNDTMHRPSFEIALIFYTQRIIDDNNHSNDDDTRFDQRKLFEPSAHVCFIMDNILS